MAYTAASELDDLDDARADLTRYRNGMRCAGTAVGVFLLSILSGSLLDSVGLLPTLVIALCVIGGIGAPVAFGFGWYWFWFCNSIRRGSFREATDSPAKRVRIAERAYRDASIREAEAADQQRLADIERDTRNARRMSR